jgi:hypothetical protein
VAEWTTVWVIVTREPVQPGVYDNPYVWDAGQNEWVHKGKALINALHEGARFETKEKAEEEALLLAMAQPQHMGKLRVESYRI